MINNLISDSTLDTYMFYIFPKEKQLWGGKLFHQFGESKGFV